MNFLINVTVAFNDCNGKLCSLIYYVFWCTEEIMMAIPLLGIYEDVPSEYSW